MNDDMFPICYNERLIKFIVQNSIEPEQIKENWASFSSKSNNVTVYLSLDPNNYGQLKNYHGAVESYSVRPQFSAAFKLYIESCVRKELNEMVDHFIEGLK